MRELFDEVVGQGKPDPQEAARQAMRAPQRKRFYKDAEIGRASRRERV